MLSVECTDYFEFLKRVFFTLRVEWRFYRSLFGTNKETVDLLNSISGHSAHILDGVFFERTLLGLRKLTDPKETQRGKKRSVSVKGLLGFPELDGKELRKLINQADHSAGFARDWANRRIAHSDYEYRSGAKPLEPASRKKVEDAMDGIASVLKYVSLEHLDTTLATHPIPPLDDERRLLEALFLGHQKITQTKTNARRLLHEKRFKELDKHKRVRELVPEWIKRADPPIDVT